MSNIRINAEQMQKINTPAAAADSINIKELKAEQLAETDKNSGILTSEAVKNSKIEHDTLSKEKASNEPVISFEEEEISEGAARRKPVPSAKEIEKQVRKEFSRKNLRSTPLSQTQIEVNNNTGRYDVKMTKSAGTFSKTGGISSKQTGISTPKSVNTSSTAAGGAKLRAAEKNNDGRKDVNEKNAKEMEREIKKEVKKRRTEIIKENAAEIKKEKKADRTADSFNSKMRSTGQNNPSIRYKGGKYEAVRPDTDEIKAYDKFMQSFEQDYINKSPEPEYSLEGSKSESAQHSNWKNKFENEKIRKQTQYRKQHEALDKQLEKFEKAQEKAVKLNKMLK